MSNDFKVGDRVRHKDGTVGYIDCFVDDETLMIGFDGCGTFAVWGVLECEIATDN